MRILFEDRLVAKYNGIDKENTVEKFVGISYLLSQYYADSSCHIEFCLSNMGVNKALKKYNASREWIIAYLDLVPDNENTWRCLEECIETIIKYKMNALLIPIVCIEYYFIKAFDNCLVDTSSTDYEIMNYFGDYRKSEIAQKGYLKENATFESYCKAVKRTYFPYDMNQVSFSDQSISFYNSESVVNHKVVTVLDKADIIITNLPIFFLNKNTAEPIITELEYTSNLIKIFNTFQKNVDLCKEYGYFSHLTDITLLQKSVEAYIRFVKSLEMD